MSIDANGNMNHWKGNHNETTPTSSTTGLMQRDFSVIRSIGNEFHYSDHQTKVLIRNLVKDTLFKKMKFVNNNQLYWQPTKKGTLCKKITEECSLSYGSDEHKEQWWQMVTIELKKTYTHLRCKTMNTIKLAFMGKLNNNIYNWKYNTKLTNINFVYS